MASLVAQAQHCVLVYVVACLRGWIETCMAASCDGEWSTSRSVTRSHVEDGILDMYGGVRCSCL